MGEGSEPAPIYKVGEGAGRAAEKDPVLNEVGEIDGFGDKFKVSDALTKAARVLESETSYAMGLLQNIQYFDRAVQAENRITQVEKNLQENNKRLLNLEKCFKSDRRKGKRRQEDLGPPLGEEERRTGTDRRGF